MQRFSRALPGSLARNPTSLSIHARFAGKYPRPKPGTSERPPHRFPDPLTSSPNAVPQTITTSSGETMTLIHRPPPTALSPFSLITNPASPLLRPSSTSASTPAMPPHIRPSAALKQANLPPRASDEVIAEIRKLRATDPMLWTCGKLAKKFGCTNGFVSAVAALPKSRRRTKKAALEAQHEEVRKGWSEKKALVVAIRKKRREFW